MSAYVQWALAQARTVVRRELMDASGKWWTDAELNQYIGDWQNDLQQDFELVWGTATLTTALNTLTLGSITPAMHRLDAVYYMGTDGGRGYRLAGRLLQDLEVGNSEWRNALPDTPRAVIQYDSTQVIIWPPLPALGTFVFEYPQELSFGGDATTVALPPWTQWSMKPYVAHRAYLRPGPVNDLKKALRYKAQYERQKARIKGLWNNWLPERYRLLKPGGHYEWEILIPPPAWSTDNPGGVPALYRSFQLQPDGVTSVFTLPLTPTDQKVFVNGLLQTPGVDYTVSAATLAFTSTPETNYIIVVWTYKAGG